MTVFLLVNIYAFLDEHRLETSVKQLAVNLLSGGNVYAG